MYHKWTCSCCGKQFDELPMSFAPRAPDPWAALNDEDRAARSVINSDACVIDGEQFFVRGCIEIPVIGLDTTFVWGAWVSVSKPSFDLIEELWEADIRQDRPPFLGWLCNEIWMYPGTYGLKTSVQLLNHGLRPSILLAPIDHPLAAEQRDGISLTRVEEIAMSAQAGH